MEDENSCTDFNTFPRLPGFGAPLQDSGEWGPGKDPFSIVPFKLPRPFPIRERVMMAFIDHITDTPEWEENVFNNKILANWKIDAMAMVWENTGIKWGDFSEKMFDYCVKELQEKAKHFKETSFTTVYDRFSCVVKSDTLVPEELKQAIRDGVKPLEDVPDRQKDWHPGSDGKVLGLVQPSLWPLVYGVSHILPDREVSLEDCIDATGSGVVIPDPLGDSEVLSDCCSCCAIEDSMMLGGTWSFRYQWLPCNVVFPNGKAKITSYINNLHPKKHAALYPVIERFIDVSLPLWDMALQWILRTRDAPRWRIYSDAMTITRFCNTNIKYCYHHPAQRPLDEGEMDDNRMYDRDEEWFNDTHPLLKPEPEPYKPLPVQPSHVLGSPEESIINAAMAKQGLQVIVKLANIHLTPEKPAYDGGTWHVDGRMNEHIAATALYYYDSDNITPSRLEFQQASDADSFSQEVDYLRGVDVTGIERVWGIYHEEPALQDLGSVLTPEGRLLVFPNVNFRRVLPFTLADPTRPGHRKILALFLVDPKVRVISTANVPPQRRDWWADEVRERSRIGELPVEVSDMIFEGVDFPMSTEKARNIRKNLTEAREFGVEYILEKLPPWNFGEF